ncbi:hypothetical protein GCM10010358_64400 [Streptomyces minutiscleroticus]|uniref:DUF503 domain-containing protein n=2 Tax=Streptomyces minutiscleroticus TaxID=68238 RepID=A0A918NWC2_9ACTN|nr:hypothetical protein GCM10010358_64400 [Streptomyces minutiscleroticus]
MSVRSGAGRREYFPSIGPGRSLYGSDVPAHVVAGPSIPYRRVIRTHMYVGTLSFDLLLGDVRSLKEKRSVVRPIVAELQRKYAVSAAEVGGQDLYRRAEIGLAVVSGDAGHLTDVLDRCERMVAARPEVELLSVRRRLHGDDD